jgi:FMN phosphatase YigB (HAD superfamily)
VLFDYGHTLVNFQRAEGALVAAYEDIRARLESLVEEELPQAEDLALQITGAIDVIVHRSYREGRLEELDIVAMLVDAFAGIGVDLSPELARELATLDHRAFSDSITAPTSTLAALEALAGRGLTMGLVSNVTLLPDLLRADLEALGIARFLSAAAFSSEVGWRKPDPRIFTHVLERLGAAPEEAVFVGDRLRDERADVPGGRAAALPDLRPDHVITTLDELPELLDGMMRKI